MSADDDNLEDQKDEVGNTTEFEVETEWVEKYYEKSFIESSKKFVKKPAGIKRGT